MAMGYPRIRLRNFSSSIAVIAHNRPSLRVAVSGLARQKARRWMPHTAAAELKRLCGKALGYEVSLRNLLEHCLTKLSVNELAHHADVLLPVLLLLRRSLPARGTYPL